MDIKYNNVFDMYINNAYNQVYNRHTICYILNNHIFICSNLIIYLMILYNKQIITYINI